MSSFSGRELSFDVENRIQWRLGRILWLAPKFSREIEKLAPHLNVNLTEMPAFGISAKPVMCEICMRRVMLTKNAR